MQRTAEPRARPRTAPPRGRSGAPHHHQARPRAHQRPQGGTADTHRQAHQRPERSPPGDARGARAAPGAPDKTIVLTALLANPTKHLVLSEWALEPSVPESRRGPARAHTGPNNQAIDTRGPGGRLRAGRGDQATGHQAGSSRRARPEPGPAGRRPRGPGRAGR